MNRYKVIIGYKPKTTSLPDYKIFFDKEIVNWLYSEDYYGDKLISIII